MTSRPATRRLVFIAAITLALPLATAGIGPAQAAYPVAPGYHFTILADSADGFEPSEFGCVALNNLGQVSFRVADTSGVQAIYRADEGGLTTIATAEGGTYDFLGRNPSINDAGQVSFAAELSGPGEAIQRGDGTHLTTIAKTAGAPFRFFGFDTSINEAGRVAFKADLDSGDQGLFSAVSSRAATTYYLASDSQFVGDQSGPSIRGHRVAFYDTLDGGLSAGIFLADGKEIDTAVGSGSEYGGFDIPSLGRHGLVAVHAFDHDAVNDFIITARKGVTHVIADRSGQFGSFGFHTPSINAAGTVAYTASLGFSNFTGAYVGKQGRPVVEVGDALAGSTVVNVVGCTEMLNDSGQVAVSVNLDDGRTVVVRADPA